MSDSEGTLFIAILLYLVITSAVVSITIMEKEGIQTSYVSWVTTVPTLENVDFTLNSSQDIAHIDIYNSWEFSNEKGLYSTSESHNKVFFQGIAPITYTDDIPITSTYTIRNPNDNEVQIIFRETSIISTVYATISETSVELWDKNGLISGINLISPVGIYDVSLDNDEYIISTSYKRDTGHAQLWINGQIVFDTFVSCKPQNIELYVGVYTFGVDTQIITLDSTIVETQIPDETQFGFIEFFTTITTILLWTVEEAYLPLLLNFIFIKVPMFGLFYIIVRLARG